MLPPHLWVLLLNTAVGLESSPLYMCLRVTFHISTITPVPLHTSTCVTLLWHILLLYNSICHTMAQHEIFPRYRHTSLDFSDSRTLSQNKPLFLIKFPVSDILLQQYQIDKELCKREPKPVSASYAGPSLPLPASPFSTSWLY